MESQRLILDELRRLWQEQLRAADILSGKAFQILGAITLFWAVMGAGIPSGWLGVLSHPWSYAWAVIVVCHLIALIIVVVGALPKHYTFPLSLDWNDLQHSFILKDKDKCLNQLLSNYLNCIEENGAIIEMKAHCLKWSLILFGTSTMLLLMILLAQLIL